LCLLTDGVTEAQDDAGALYSQERAQRMLVDLVQADASAGELVAALRSDVLAFADGADPHDDLTIVVLRWNGPVPVAAAVAATQEA